MNIKANNFFKNLSYTFLSNLVSIFVSLLTILIIPKLLETNEYGYWQLYIFYAIYVGFFHFGWNDGIYLRYGGKNYKDLDKKLFFSQFYSLFFSQFVIAILISILSLILLNDDHRIFIFIMVALNLVIMNVLSMLQFILQATNRIKEYSWTILLGRLFYLFLITSFLTVGFRDYKLMIIADLISKLLTLFFAMVINKEIVFYKAKEFYFSINEILMNIRVGIKLMFANISNILIVGTVRFGIERSWNVETFGKVSLTLSVTNLMMIFVNSVGIILFPILKRTDRKQLPNIYLSLREPLMALLIGALILYFPIKVFLGEWLPNYAESLLYMSLIFPMFIYEGKMALLINTYLKTLRKEKFMLKVNLLSFVLSLITTCVTTLLMKNLTFSILSIFLLLTFRSIIAELYLSRILGIRIYKDIYLELVISLIFILVGWFINTWIAMLIFTITYIVYFLIKKKEISTAFNTIKSLIKG